MSAAVAFGACAFITIGGRRLRAAIAECDTPAGVLARTAEACRHENGDNAPANG